MLFFSIRARKDFRGEWWQPAFWEYLMPEHVSQLQLFLIIEKTGSPEIFQIKLPVKFSITWREELGIAQNYQFSVMLIKKLWQNPKNVWVGCSVCSNCDRQKCSCWSTDHNRWPLGRALLSRALPPALLYGGALPSPSPKVPAVLSPHLSGISLRWLPPASTTAEPQLTETAYLEATCMKCLWLE